MVGHITAELFRTRRRALRSERRQGQEDLTQWRSTLASLRTLKLPERSPEISKAPLQPSRSAAGDGVLLEFPSVVDTVECAVAMQRELNVRYVLEGSVQRGGNKLRVNVQLIDAAADFNHFGFPRSVP